MGKRKRHRSDELPLFDLPIRSTTDEADDGAADGEPGEPSRPAGEPEPETNTGGADPEGSAQLDLIELSGAAARAASTGGPAPGAGEDAGDEHDDRALLGDRLLGGLADLAVQLVITGLALAAARALGVSVTAADWMPFAVLALVFSFLYWIVPLAFWGQTPGMAWVGHVARAEDGEALTFGQTFRRWLGALFTLAFAGLPLLLAFTGRSFSDRLSDSHTVAEP